MSTDPLPSPATIATIAASLIGPNSPDFETATRTAIMLWKTSETKLGHLQKYLDEIGPRSQWQEWADLDQDEDRRRHWLLGGALVPDSLKVELTSRVEKGKAESKELGAQGPPEKHRFTLAQVAVKILPQKNITDRHATARKFFASEIDSLPEESPVRDWLTKTEGQRTNEKEAWWVWAELLIRWQRKQGRFRKNADKWKQNLAERRKESQPEGRWDEFYRP